MGLQHQQRRMIQVVMGLAFLSFLAGGLTLLLMVPAQDAVMIRLATDPPEATVQIDGVTIGQTPISTILPEGEHELILSKEGFKIIDRKIFADPSAPPSTNQYRFGLIPTQETLTRAEKSRRIESLERWIEEAFKRGDYVAPERDNAWDYLNLLQELDPSNPLIPEMRQRIRRVFKQQAEMMHRHNDLS